MRHGKAVQADGLADRERPLTPRGRRDCEMIAPAIAQDYRPDRILCSPVLRTRETLAAMLPGIGEVSDIRFLEELYDHPGDYAGVISANGRESERLLVIGHNPGLEDLVDMLTGVQRPLKTSSIAVLSSRFGWAAAGVRWGRLDSTVTPRG